MNNKIIILIQSSFKHITFSYNFLHFDKNIDNSTYMVKNEINKTIYNGNKMNTFSVIILFFNKRSITLILAISLQYALIIHDIFINKRLNLFKERQQTKT